MSKLFRFVDWFNKNHTGEEVIAGLILLSAVSGVILGIIYTRTLGLFIFTLGLSLVVNAFIILQLSRWYTRKVEKRMENFDYDQIVDVEEESN